MIGIARMGIGNPSSTQVPALAAFVTRPGTLSDPIPVKSTVVPRVINFAAADSVAMLTIRSLTLMGASADTLVIVAGVVAARVSRISRARACGMSFTCAITATAPARAQALAPSWPEKSGRRGMGRRWRNVLMRQSLAPKYRFQTNAVCFYRRGGRVLSARAIASPTSAGVWSGAR